MLVLPYNVKVKAYEGSQPIFWGCFTVYFINMPRYDYRLTKLRDFKVGLATKLAADIGELLSEYFKAIKNLITCKAQS